MSALLARTLSALRRHLGITAIVVVTTLGIGVGTAYAWLTTSASGTGSATVDALQTVAITGTAATPTTPLLPGQSGDATFRVSNPNGTAMTVVSVVQSGAVGVVGGSGCTLVGSGVTFADRTSLSIPVPADAVDQVLHLPGSVSMSATAANGCQGATFSIPVRISARVG